MPNDIPDWTRATTVQPVSSNGQLLGDTGSPAPLPDQVIESATWAGAVNAGAVVASFKAAVGATIAVVGAVAAPVPGAADAVTPSFGQATTAGNMLVAAVSSNSVAEPTTGAAGWVKVISVQFISRWQAIWVRPNCGAAEAAPTFTATGSVTNAHAVAAEFSGAAVAAPQENTGSAAVAVNSVSVASATADANFGDLVLSCVRWITFGGLPASFSDAFNNGAVAVAMGSVTNIASNFYETSHFAYGVVPAAKVALPLGVSLWKTLQPPWLYPLSSVTLSGTLAANTAGALVAAVAAKTVYLHGFSCDVDASGLDNWQLREIGSTVRWIGAYVQSKTFDFRGLACAGGAGVELFNATGGSHRFEATLAYTQA